MEAVLSTDDSLTLPVDGSPAKQPLRCADPKQALTWLKGRQRKLIRRLEMYEAIEADYDRVPPPENDEAYGHGGAVRVNWGGMKEGVDDGALTDYNLVTQPETYVRLMTRSRSPGLTARLREIEREHKRLLDGWDGFLPELEKCNIDRRMHGIGAFRWSKPNSWHFKSCHPRDLIYPEGATLNPDDWSQFGLRTEFKITDLLMYLREGEASAKLGWQIDNIKMLIDKMKQGCDFSRDMTYEDLYNNDMYFASRHGEVVKGFQHFVKEFPGDNDEGKVSEYFVVESEDIGYLYKGEKRHESMGKVFALFPLSMGKGLLRHVRGYGLEMLAYHDVENLTTNRFVETYLTTGGPIIQGQGDDDLQRLALEMKQYGAYTLMPSGINLAATQFPDTSKRGLEVMSMMEGKANKRSRTFGGPDASQRTPEMTATQSRLLAQQGQGAEANEVARYTHQLTKFHRILFEKMWATGPNDPGGKEVAKAKKYLKEKGVTQEDFDAIDEVRARRTFGDGNPRNQFLAMMDLDRHYGRMTESGKKLYDFLLAAAALNDNDLAAELTGYGVEVDDRAVDQAWRAQLENTVFETSDVAQPMGPDDDHLVHLGSHTQFAEDADKRWQNGELSPSDCLNRLSRTQAHVQLHLQAMSEDAMMIDAYRVFMQRWAVLQNEMTKLQQNLQDAQKAQQAQQLEELRNPKPSVKDQETAMTEQLKRELMTKESEFRISIMDKENAAHTAASLRAAAVRQAAQMQGDPSGGPGIDEWGRPRTTVG